MKVTESDTRRVQHLSQLLQIPLSNQPLHVTLTNVELAVFGQGDGAFHKVSICPRKLREDSGIWPLPVFSLDLSSVFKHSDVDEEVLGRVETPRQIDVCPLPLISCKHVAILTNVLLLFRTQKARMSGV